MLFFVASPCPKRVDTMRHISETVLSKGSHLIHFNGVGLIPTAELFADNRISTATALLCQDDRHRSRDGISGPAYSRSTADERAVSKNRRLNVFLRLGGLALLCAAVSAGYLCTQLVRSGGPHPATVVELLLSLGMFICMSGGLLLLTMGVHVFDEVEISERWRPRR